MPMNQIACRMLTTLSCAMVLLSVKPCSGETFFGPGVITIASNETIIVTTVLGYGAAGTLDGKEWSIYYKPDTLNFDFMPIVGGAITGPHIIEITNQACLTYQKLIGSAVKTFVVQAGTTNTITIPEGKTIRFFVPLGQGTVEGELNRGGQSLYLASSMWLLKNETLSGPMTIRIWGQDYSDGRKCTFVFSYYYTDEIVQLPAQGVLPRLGQRAEVNVEKSGDLTNWTPTAAFLTTEGSNSFYRLRILR